MQIRTAAVGLICDSRRIFFGPVNSCAGAIHFNCAVQKKDSLESEPIPIRRRHAGERAPGERLTTISRCRTRMARTSNIAVRHRVRGYRNEDEATATEALEPGVARRSAAPYGS